LISLIENYQDKDGNIVVPEVLREYMWKDIIKN
jgi:seryl-tRNA synthetase